MTEGLNIDNTTLQIGGAIIGSLLGAVVGATSTYILSERARKKQKELDDINSIRRDIKSNTGALVAIEDNLHRLLITCLTNVSDFRDMARGIYDEKANTTTFNLNVANQYRINEDLSNNLLNIEITVLWQALELEKELHNNNIEFLTSYYSELRSNVRKIQLTDPGSLVLDPIKSDNQTIISAANGNLRACENFKEKCFQILARIQLYTAVHKKIDYQNTTYDEVQKYKDKLIYYKPTAKILSKKIEELKKTYTEEKAFGFNEVYK